MGIYFIAAGSSSRNREKSLDKSFAISELQGFLNAENLMELRDHFSSGNNIYIWGADKGSFNELKNVSTGEYVIDVKNSKVIQVFQFCFYINTEGDTSLRNHIGWDEENPEEQRRPFKYVFFLKNPRPPGKDQREKVYFQNAFEMQNKHWLRRQKWFNESQVLEACQRKRVSTVKELLWGSDGESQPLSQPQNPNISNSFDHPETISPPQWLIPVIEQVSQLHRRLDHQERDHEDLAKAGL